MFLSTKIWTRQSFCVKRERRTNCSVSCPWRVLSEEVPHSQGEVTQSQVGYLIPRQGDIHSQGVTPFPDGGVLPWADLWQDWGNPPGRNCDRTGVPLSKGTWDQWKYYGMEMRYPQKDVGPVEVLWDRDWVPHSLGVDSQTDACENITSVHPSDAVCNKKFIFQNFGFFSNLSKN